MISIGARLWAGRSGVQIPVDAKDLSLLQNILTSCGVHPASHAMGTGARVAMGIKFNTPSHLMPR